MKFGCEIFASEYERYHTVMFSNYASQARLIPLEAQLDDSSHWETLQAEKNLSVLSVHCPFFSLLDNSSEDRLVLNELQLKAP